MTFVKNFSFLVGLFAICNGFLIPPHWQTALMARYIVHKSDWVSIATLSTSKDIKGYPFVNLKSMSDGPVEDGKGVPYLYLTDMDLSGIDIKADNRVSIMATLAQSDYCKSEGLDPQDPRCARILLTGKIVKVQNGTSEYEFAQNALFSRHPSMKNWPTNHNFFFAKLDIQRVAVLDFFGGVKYVSVEDYMNAHPNSKTDIFFEHPNPIIKVIID